MTTTPTATATTTEPRTEANIAAALVVVSMVVRSMAPAPSRELVELTALARASGPLPDAIGTTPLWDALLWGWVQLLEAGSARVLSDALSALTVAAIFLTARRMLSTGLSLSVALLVLLTPLTLGTSQDIRPGALLLLLVVVAWGGWLAGWRGGWRGTGHVAAVIGAALTHPWGALAVLPQAILRPQRRWLLLGPLCALTLLWMPGDRRLHPEVLVDVLRAFALDDPTALVIVGLLGVTLFRAPKPHSVALTAWLMVPPLVALLLCVDLRYAAVCLPALWLLVGQGLAGLSLGRRAVVLAVLLTLGGLSLAYRMNNPLPRGDVDALVAALPPLLPADHIAADEPGAWALAMGRPVTHGISDAAGARQILDEARGGRLLWLRGRDGILGEATGVVEQQAVLQRVSAGRGSALLVCPGCRAADFGAAVFDPVGDRSGGILMLYATAAVVLPDLNTDGPGEYAVDVVARGTPAGGVPAKLEITIEGAQPVGDWVWSLPEQTTAHRVRFVAEQPGAVVLRFLNDGNIDGEDRNVWIEAAALSRYEGGDQQPDGDQQR